MKRSVEAELGLSRYGLEPSSIRPLFRAAQKIQSILRETNIPLEQKGLSIGEIGVCTLNYKEPGSSCFIFWGCLSPTTNFNEPCCKQHVPNIRNFCLPESISKYNGEIGLRIIEAWEKMFQEDGFNISVARINNRKNRLPFGKNLNIKFLNQKRRNKFHSIW
ncbi:MAG: hypothetical protein P8Y17_01555 [Patescibacteria group bacterium]